MPQKNLAAGANFEINLAKFRNGAVLASTVTTTDAAAVFVVEQQIDGATGDEWLALKLFDPTTKTDVSNLTGASKIGWAEVPCADKVRIRRTDGGGAGTVGLCNLNFREG